MLFRTLKSLIEKGQTVGIEEKMDIFYAAGKLTGEEYGALLAALIGG